MPQAASGTSGKGGNFPMSGEELLKNMDLIDPVLVEAASHTVKRKIWIKWSAVAAAVAAIVAVLLFWKPNEGKIVKVGQLERHYKAILMAQSETAPVYPWEYLTEIERYPSMTLGETKYRTRAKTLDAAYLGAEIGTCFFTGYDIYTDKEYTLEKTAYEITGISPSELVAVELGGEYCVFLKDAYSPPQDFGEFWDLANLSNHVKLESFIHYNGQNENNQQTWHRLENDTPLWEMLDKCRNAPYLELERFYDHDIETISFSVTSETLGVYKHGFQITSDGYILTNLMEWGYVFHIGENAAREIIQHVKEHSIPIPQEPYYHFLYGTFIGIEDGFILVDDTVLCVNEKDGMIFRVPMQDIRIARAVELGYVSVGDVVLVNFTGNVDTASGNTISEPVSIQAGTLWDGKILIEE